jgi:N,N'-diacetylchitobiose phosphorylase
MSSDGLLLSNGRYNTLVTVAGGGYSALGDIQLTRWSGDSTRDADGWFFYLRDRDSGDCWSAGHQPVRRPPERYEAYFGGGVAVLLREDLGIETRTEITVAADRDLEWRRITVTNLGPAPRRIDVTTCAEVALNAAAADAGHPAFSKLFVQTEFLPALGALLARRRPRSPEEPTLFLGHTLLAPDAPLQDIAEFETDRARFIGRGRTAANPLAMTAGTVLSGTVGNVLDPVLALRRAFRLEPGASLSICGVLAAGASRAVVEAALVSAGSTGPSEAIFAPAGGLGAPVLLPVTAPRCSRPAPGVEAAVPDAEPLRFFNGHGGFNPAGDEYVIRVNRTRDGLTRPPLAWVNVIANETTGFVASECGLGFTWNGNSQQHRLTPWFNDPVSDPVGEALYLRDDEAGVFWSPTPAPTPGSGSYEARHGFGSTSWRHTSRSLEQEVTAFVARDAPVKIVRLRVTNRGQEARRLSVFSYAEWVLGGLRADARASARTERTQGGEILLAVRRDTVASGGGVAFAAVFGPADQRSLSADRAGFLGQYGDAEDPEAVGTGSPLDGRVGEGLDPCAAFQLTALVAAGATLEWNILLGEATDRQAALTLCERFRSPAAVGAALEVVRAFWRDTLSGVRVETPSPAMDLMVNGWLAYQNLSCRMWARSALYQSGGAFGFRDQLQDAAALLYLAPGLTRKQILLHAAHQFVEGDVLHWWHPPTSRGIRTHFSDDLLWLPYVTEFYVGATGDASVLDEPVRFLTGPELPSDQDEVLLEPEDSGSRAGVYEHCCRALDRSLTRGAHGLPLMGCGDWNDGMNRVGRLGRGESVWLGFFLYEILERFIPLAESRKDAARVARYRAYRGDLGKALNEGGWDGGWYRRAYYDDGTPLGSAQNDECRIDLIAQAWSVLAGAAPVDRAELALDAIERHLVDETSGLIRLLTPPFDRTPHDPGYIKGYLPGIRENGGQYTHAALWAVRALAEAGREERAARLFEMLTPVIRGGTATAIATYKVEPYVIAADVYGSAPHVGRGGWTWYTGSAGWMFRVALESILGVTIREGKTLALCPCVPAEWPGFAVWYRLPDGRTRYEIRVRRVAHSTTVRATGLEVRVDDGDVLVELRQDGGSHRIEVDLGDDVGPRYRPRLGTL